MTQDEIIEMAKEAGFVEYELDDGTTSAFDKRYEDFAKLVAAEATAKEREACTEAAIKAAEKAIDVAIALERDACVKTLESISNAPDMQSYANAIRARGEQA